MFPFARCSHERCREPAISGRDTCWRHLVEDRPGAVESCQAALVSSGIVKDLNLAGIPLSGLDLSRKHFYGCRFSRCYMSSVLWTGALFRMCFFDDAEIDSCDFSKTDIQFCCFAGAKLTNVSFENSEIVHDSFNGVEARECTFNNSNLYNTRFIKARLFNTDFVDCNIKRAYFVAAFQESCSFKYSNTQEAITEPSRIYQ